MQHATVCIPWSAAGWPELVLLVQKPQNLSLDRHLSGTTHRGKDTHTVERT